MDLIHKGIIILTDCPDFNKDDYMKNDKVATFHLEINYYVIVKFLPHQHLDLSKIRDFAP